MDSVLNKQSLNRKTIDKSIYIPYGIEIEVEGIDYDEGVKVLRHKITDDWRIKTDRSLDNGGIELVSPVLTNTKENIIILKKIASTLEFLGAKFEHASFQINFDAYDFTNDNIIYLLKIFSIYENVIYRFSSGVNESMRHNINYALPLGRIFYYKYNNSDIQESYNIFINNKSFALSLKTKSRNCDDPIKVVEFRTPNGTCSFYLWMNYIVFFSSFLKCVKTRKYDKEYIDHLFSRMELFEHIDELIRVDEVKANEFAHLIYQSDAEKECFFRQYYDKKILTR